MQEEFDVEGHTFFDGKAHGLADEEGDENEA